MRGRLEGRTALVTGSTSGIGKAIAVRFAAEGAAVVVSGRDEARGEGVVQAIREAGGRASFVAADLSAGGAAVDQLVAGAQAAFGTTIDILVNNAAYLHAGPTADCDEAAVSEVLMVNVGVPVLLTAALAPAMVASGGGAIVNVGAVATTKGQAGIALYSASKGALRTLTKAWAAEFGPGGVRVNEVSAGPTYTEGVEHVRDLLDQFCAPTPAGRPGRPEEVAAAALFLASDEASHVHGTTLDCDGGIAAT